MTGAEISLERLVRRLAETPASLRSADGVRVDAVVRDVLEGSGADVRTPLLRALLARCAPSEAVDDRTSRATLVAAWLLADPAFAAAAAPGDAAADFLGDAVPLLARAVEPSLFVTDPERREEMARRALAAFGLRPAGESERTAADRLAALDSVGRSSLLRDAWGRLKRAREVREAMRRREAEASAARWGGE